MGIARSTYYDKPATSIDNTALVETMAGISDSFEAYGYRRMQAALRHHGLVVNHKKIRRLMREHDLQPRRRRRYVATTDGDHELPIFPNLAKDIVPDGPNQLWAADITYVAITSGFVYVAVILDAWSRKVVGYAIGRSIDVRLTLAALRSAVERRKPPPGCVHHGDRGCADAGLVVDASGAMLTTGRVDGSSAVAPNLPRRAGSPRHILVLTSGGADGAFGAGVITAWTASGQRPQFDIVSGTSTGALQATAAFLGPDYDALLERIYTSMRTRDIFRSNGVKTLLGTGLYDPAPLRRLLEEVIALARGERLQVMLDDAELAAVDDFRFSRRMPSRSAAVRALLR